MPSCKYYCEGRIQNNFAPDLVSILHSNPFDTAELSLTYRPIKKKLKVRLQNSEWPGQERLENKTQGRQREGIFRSHGKSSVLHFATFLNRTSLCFTLALPLTQVHLFHEVLHLETPHSISLKCAV